MRRGGGLVLAGRALAAWSRSARFTALAGWSPGELGPAGELRLQPAQGGPISDRLGPELHLRDRITKTYEEEVLPTHADLKYDQFLHEDGVYTLIDFDYFAMAETSYDLAKFCAYAIPSAPRSWEDTVAAEDTRRAFLNRYRELRPDATLDRFQIYEALVLALRAMTMMWSQHRGWEHAAEVFLVMAQERLNTRLPEVA